MGTIGLGRRIVNGRSLEPSPPAITTAFIEASLYGASNQRSCPPMLVGRKQKRRSNATPSHLLRYLYCTTSTKSAARQRNGVCPSKIIGETNLLVVTWPLTL